MNLMEGGYWTWKNLPSRFVIGAWCLFAFVVVQAYQSTLITYVVAPKYSPLAKNVYDVARNPEIQFLVQKNRAFDLVFSVRFYFEREREREIVELYNPLSFGI